MRLFLLDSGLKDNSGHNFLFAKLVADEARQRGIEVIALCHQDFPQDDALSFQPRPMFESSYYYVINEKDPVEAPVASAKKLNFDFYQKVKALGPDAIARDDLVLVPSINQNNLVGLARWLREMGPQRVPAVAVALLFAPGVSVDGDTVEVYDSLRALQYRMALINFRDMPHVHLMGTGHQTATDHAYLARAPVPPHPLLVDLPKNVPEPEPRTLLLFAGNSAVGKNIQLIPGAVRLLTERLPDWAFLVQANDTTSWVLKEPVEALRAMAAEVPQLALRTGYIDESAYRRLFMRSAAVAIPYDATAYRHASSGVLWEAIAMGRPAIVPRGTYLEREAAAWNASHAAIDTGTSESIADGIASAIENGTLDERKAGTSAEAFRAQNGPARFLDTILAMRRS
jgi:hypothetical protein